MFPGPDDWPRLRELFEAALALPKDARSAFLDAACGDNVDLRARVVRLLESHERAGSFLEAAPEAAAESRTDDDLVGQQIGPYLVHDRLGAGGMGDVYRAYDQRLRRPVALKFLHSPQWGTDTGTRVHREARAAARLDHPFICKVYEVGEAGTATYIAMEYVSGQTLAARLASGPLLLPEALPIAIEIGEALAAAHRGGIVHRDLKPANIMVAEDGHVKVLDFGLASRADRTRIDTSAQTLASSTGGTLAYMAPEQLRGEQADVRSDIFAFGIVLTELVTGLHPFGKSTSIETASAILHEEPAAWPAAVRAPALLHDIVRKALAKAPADRYASADGLVTDLRAVNTSRDVATFALAGRPATRSRRWGAAAALIAVAITAAIVMWQATPRETSPAPIEPRFSQVTTSGTIISAALSPDGLSVAYIAEEKGTRQLLVRDVSGGRALLLRDNPWLERAHWTADGTHVVYFDSDGGFVIPRFGGDPRKSISLWPTSWSADGARAVAMSVSVPSFRVFSADGKPLSEAITMRDAKQLHGIDWHHSSQTLLLHGIDHQDRATIWTTSPDGSDQKPVHVDSGHIVSARWSPPERVIYFVRAREQAADVASVDLARPGSVRVIAAGTPQSDQLSVSADGRRLLLLRGAVRSNLAVMDAARPESTPRWITTGTAVFDEPAVSPDKQWTAAVVGDGTVRAIVKLSLNGGEPIRLTDGKGLDRSPAWSPDGRMIAFGSKRNGENAVWLMDADGANLRKLERTSVSDSLGVGWAPDGRVMWQQRTPEKGINYRLRDLATGAEELLTRDSASFVSSPRFAPDGRRVVFQWGRVPSTRTGLWLLDWPARTEHRFGNLSGRVLGWSAGGEALYVIPFPSARVRSGIYRLSADSGAAELVTTVPSGGIVSGSVIPGESSIVASIRERGGDAWTIDLGGRR
jgi:serine/threonine protein kinase